MRGRAGCFTVHAGAACLYIKLGLRVAVTTVSAAVTSAETVGRLSAARGRVVPCSNSYQDGRYRPYGLAQSMPACPLACPCVSDSVQKDTDVKISRRWRPEKVMIECVKGEGRSDERDTESE